jgi:hypothetical protein
MSRPGGEGHRGTLILREIPSSGRRYPLQPVLRPPSNRAKAAKVRQLSVIFSENPERSRLVGGAR